MMIMSAVEIAALYFSLVLNRVSYDSWFMTIRIVMEMMQMINSHQVRIQNKEMKGMRIIDFLLTYYDGN